MRHLFGGDARRRGSIAPHVAAVPCVQDCAARTVLAWSHEAVRMYDDKFPCPSCRTVFECDAVEMHDAWNADDALDALLDSDEDFDEDEKYDKTTVVPTRRSKRVKKTDCM